MNHVVLDNFLNQEDLLNIQEVLLGQKFPWYFAKNKVFTNPEIDNINDFQFVHQFFTGSQKVSDYFYLLDPIFNKLPITGYARSKANITPRTESLFTYDLHTDFKKPQQNIRTAVFYVNSNNGKTIFEDGTEVDSVENRLVVFDSNIKHAGTSCTDQKVRCVINLNYFGQLP
jgi:hypothetical protein